MRLVNSHVCSVFTQRSPPSESVGDTPAALDGTLRTGGA